MLLTECDGPEPLTHLLCLCTNPGLPVVQGRTLRDPASLKAFKVSDNAVWGCVRLLTVYTGKGVLLPLWKLAELYQTWKTKISDKANTYCVIASPGNE